MKEIDVPLSMQDLEDLRNGKEFNWEFDGVEVHLFTEEEQ